MNEQEADQASQQNPDSNVLRDQRVEKLQQLKDRGIEPYPHQFQRTHVIEDLNSTYEDKLQEDERAKITAKIAGRIMGYRDMGKAAFIDIRDGTGQIQGYSNIDQLGEEAYQIFKELDIGDFIGVEGPVFKTRRGELSVRVDDFELLSKALRPLPEKWHGLKDVEKRYRERSMDLLTNEDVKEKFVARSRLITAFRKTLNQLDFLEVETPILQTAPGGATAEPFVTHHNALDQDLYLRIAPELYLKRLVIGGMEKVYELGKSFRNEGVSTEHNPEFTTIEIYQAYADYKDAMNLIEKLVVEGAQKAVGGTTVTYCDQEIDLSRPWNRLSMVGAVEEILDHQVEGLSRSEFIQLAKEEGLKLPDELSQYSKGELIEALFDEYIEDNLIQPTFVTDFPRDISPLAKNRRDGSTEITERFEAFIGTLELANAFTELNDPVEQRKRFEQHSEAESYQSDRDFLRTLEYGMPPTAGIGIGIDRLMMLMTNSRSIREVILFPTLKRKGT